MYQDRGNGDQIVSGMIVYDASGEKVGTVAEYMPQNGYMLVQKGWLFHKDFYVPLSAITGATDEAVTLRLGKEELQQESFAYPPGDATAGTTDTGYVATDAHAATDLADRGYAMPQVGGDRTLDRETGDTIDRMDRGGEIRVPVREEELVVGKRSQEEGRVHIHKDVVEERRTVTVPLEQEYVTVERTPIADGAAAVGDDVFTEREIEVPVMGEEPVVSKRVAGVEEVLIHKDLVTEQEQISDTVRKERVVVDGVDAEGRASVDRQRAAYSSANGSGGDRLEDAARRSGDDLGRTRDRLTGK